MKRQKIVFYFTPDTSIARRDFSSLGSKINSKKGLYSFAFGSQDASLIKDATCNSIKSAQESTASLNLPGLFNGAETDNLFFVNDYWEIWDDANNWCHFRGMVRSKNRDISGKSKTLVLDLANAGWWVFGDKSIFYINPILAGSFGDNKTRLFESVKSKYALLGKQDEIKGIFTKSTTPNKYLEFIVNSICAPRIQYIKDNNFGESGAIKTITAVVDDNFKSREILVSRQKSGIEGSVWDAIKMFEGYPFCQLFIEEGVNLTRIKWRYSRWRDNTGQLCFADLAKDEDPIRIYSNDKKDINTGDFKGLIKKTENETVSGLVNAFFLVPWATAKLSASLATQIAVHNTTTNTIIDEESIIRNGYMPQEVKIPFLPEYLTGLTDEEYDSDLAANIRSILKKRKKSVGEELIFYSSVLRKMYTGYKEAKSGTLIMKNNLPIQIGRNIELYEQEIGGNEVATHMSLNKITQYFDPNSPRTVLEYSRGFKGMKGHQRGDALAGVLV